MLFGEGGKKLNAVSMKDVCMDGLWELPENIQSYVYENEVSLQLYTSPLSEGFEGLAPEVGIATVIVQNEAGEILFIEHSEDGRVWELPSGHIEEGENPENAARREVREETGYLVDDVLPVVAVVWPFTGTVRVQLVFCATVGDKVSHSDGEAASVAWRDGVPENVTFGELGQEIYEYYIDSAVDENGESRLKQGLALVGVGLSAVALRGVQKYRELQSDGASEE